VVYSVHYGFYDYTVQYLEEFKAYIIAEGLVEKLGAIKEVLMLPSSPPYDQQSITRILVASI
jgi:hypothetical protein